MADNNSISALGKYIGAGLFYDNIDAFTDIASYILVFLYKRHPIPQALPSNFMIGSVSEVDKNLQMVLKNTFSFLIDQNIIDTVGEESKKNPNRGDSQVEYLLTSHGLYLMSSEVRFSLLPASASNILSDILIAFSAAESRPKSSLSTRNMRHILIREICKK